MDEQPSVQMQPECDCIARYASAEVRSWGTWSPMYGNLLGTNIGWLEGARRYRGRLIVMPVLTSICVRHVQSHCNRVPTKKKYEQGRHGHLHCLPLHVKCQVITVLVRTQWPDLATRDPCSLKWTRDHDHLAPETLC